jgi:hypothetical protein
LTTDPTHDDPEAPVDTRPPAPQPPAPAPGWHQTAVVLADDRRADPAAARGLLEHAAAGLHHRPADADAAADLARLLLDQAVAELALAGIACPPPADPDAAEAVHAADVRPLLAAAAARLADCAGCPDGDTAVPLACARAASLTRQALDAARRA